MVTRAAPARINALLPSESWTELIPSQQLTRLEVLAEECECRVLNRTATHCFKFDISQVRQVEGRGEVSAATAWQ